MRFNTSETTGTGVSALHLCRCFQINTICCDISARGLYVLGQDSSPASVLSSTKPNIFGDYILGKYNDQNMQNRNAVDISIETKGHCSCVPQVFGTKAIFWKENQEYVAKIVVTSNGGASPSLNEKNCFMLFVNVPPMVHRNCHPIPVTPTRFMQSGNCSI